MQESLLQTSLFIKRLTPSSVSSVFSVTAAAKQMVPPSTAAGIDADVQRGMFKEIDDPGPKKFTQEDINP